MDMETILIQTGQAIQNLPGWAWYLLGFLTPVASSLIIFFHYLASEEREA